MAERAAELVANWKDGRYDKADDFLVEAHELKEKIPSKEAALRDALDAAMDEAVEILDKLAHESAQKEEAAKRGSLSQDGKRLAIGDVVSEPYGMTVLLVRECDPPADSWFVNAAAAYRNLFDRRRLIRWFEAFPLSGGSIQVAEPVSTFLRKASPEDAQAAFRAANKPAKAMLAAVFPFLSGR